MLERETAVNPLLVDLDDVLVALVLGFYVLVVVYVTKPLYHYMLSRGLKRNQAVYYNRKIIHVAAGGVVALVTPYVFSSPIMPFVMSMILGLMLYLARRSGRLMYWFQVEENMYEVNFVVGWGVSVLVLWLLLGDPRMAILPALMISFGDAATGFVRNFVFGYRTKHWIGNIAMAALVIPLGALYAGITGVVAGILATLVERYEKPPLDDNILIALVVTVVIVASRLLAATAPV